MSKTVKEIAKEALSGMIQKKPVVNNEAEYINRIEYTNKKDKVMQEFKNGDEVEAFKNGKWDKATYIGFDKSNRQHVVSAMCLEYSNVLPVNIRPVKLICNEEYKGTMTSNELNIALISANSQIEDKDAEIVKLHQSNEERFDILVKVNELTCEY